MKNSFDFISKANSWGIDKNEVQVSFDLVNLYPSIPLREGILILLDQLDKDNSYKFSTRLTISEIRLLKELVVISCGTQ